MDNVNVSQYTRPLRIAFLVNNNTYRQAVKSNTSIWGGTYNPIIPVKKTDNSKERERNISILTDFDPDFIVNLTNREIPYIKNAFPNGIMIKKHLMRNQFYSKNPKGKYTLGCGLSVLPVMQTVWEKETKAIKGKSNAILIRKGQYKEWSDYILFQFGAFLEGYEPDFVEVYRRYIKPEEIRFDIKKFDAKNIFKKFSPIGLTGYSLEVRPHSSWIHSSYIIYLGKIKNWKDLIEFWNIRATGRVVIFLPYEHYQEYKNTLTAFIKDANYEINENVSNEACMLKSSHVTEDQLQEVGKWITTTMGTSILASSYNELWTSREKPYGGGRWIDAGEVHNTTSSDTLIISDRYLTPFKLLKPDVIQNTKFAFPRTLWANVINFAGPYQSKYTFSFPVDKNVEEVVQREFFISGLDDTRLSRDGIVKYPKYFREDCKAFPVETLAVLEALCKSAGLSIKPSRSGILTTNIINYLGGIENCRMFKISGVREAFKEINRKGALAVNEIIKIIGTNWKPEHAELVVDFNLGRPLTPAKTFQHLIDEKLLRPGLNFVCKQCQTEKWYGMNEFTEKFSCPYCFTEQDIPRVDKLHWHYKTNGILGLSGVGFGTIPVIVSLWRYMHIPTLRNAQWHTSITVKGIDDPDFEREIDYVYLISDSNNSHALVLGEAKNFDILEKKDFKRMLEVAKRFPIKPSLSFSTLRDTFTGKEKAEMNSLVKKGYQVIALTRQELDPYDLFDRFDKLRNKYAVELEDFAENTRILNLA
jgi:hypothetical protein